jgi:phosphate/sulfate permease
VRWRSVGEIVLGWVLAPVLAALISFIGLFVLANVFLLPVATP